jgi:hypothetical protein
MLYTALPLLRGWMWQYVEREGYLYIGKELLLDTIEAPGWLMAVSGYFKGSLDGKYVRIHVEIDGPDKAFPIDFTLEGVKEFGLTMPIPFGGYITRYDDTEKIYVGCITPSPPIPFCRRFQIRLIPPSAPVEESTAVPIQYHAAYILAKVIDVDEFMRSVHKLFGMYAMGR